MTNPRKGDCSTCHWFERGDNPPPNGSCLVNPPTPHITMVPKSMGPRGPELQPAIQGIHPATVETKRCEKWRPVGVLPDLAIERH